MSHQTFLLYFAVLYGGSIAAPIIAVLLVIPLAVRMTAPRSGLPSPEPGVTLEEVERWKRAITPDVLAQPGRNNDPSFPAPSPRVTAALDAATAVLDPPFRVGEVPRSDCCHAILGTRGRNWTLADGFFCRACGRKCLRVIFAEKEAPPQRIPFGCIKCNPHALPKADSRCECLRECGSQLCEYVPPAGRNRPA